MAAIQFPGLPLDWEVTAILLCAVTASPCSAVRVLGSMFALPTIQDQRCLASVREIYVRAILPPLNKSDTCCWVCTIMCILAALKFLPSPRDGSGVFTLQAHLDASWSHIATPQLVTMRC